MDHPIPSDTQQQITLQWFSINLPFGNIDDLLTDIITTWT